MKNKFLDLSLSSGERKGVIVLIVIIIIVAGIQAFLKLQPTRPAPFEDTAFFTHLKNESAEPVDPDSAIPSGYFSLSEFRDTFELFSFDPNTVTAADLSRMGLSNRVIRTWLNYRRHGGVFREASDIKKIYGMQPDGYNRLHPYVHIKSSQIVNARSIAAVVGKKDINLCDSADLIFINGIGPVLSGRIVRYRNLLGGFHEIAQMQEVYGLTDSLVNVVSLEFYADTTNVRKININEASEEILRRHPYIGRYTASGIMRYRSSVQKINQLDELKTNGILTGEQFEKVKKYLVI